MRCIQDQKCKNLRKIQCMQNKLDYNTRYIKNKLKNVAIFEHIHLMLETPTTVFAYIPRNLENLL